MLQELIDVKVEIVIYMDVPGACLREGASINDVRIFGVFFDPLPPPCPNFIY